ncbi:MAG TPA: FecR family protein [Pyrinomonadaceae bacterium]|nr:FecR family protein [Pyrinomonadaceae bacterium]
MKNLKVWPHLVIIAVVVAVAAGVGVGLWMKHEQTASAEALPNAARIQRVEGEVALDNSDAANAQSDQWIAATDNQPVSVGDRIYTRDNSRASLAFTGRNFARLNPNTSLDVIALNDERTQLALRDGSAMFDVGYLDSGDLFEVATPYGAVDLQQPGLYNVGIDNGQVLVSVLSGLAQVVGLGGSGQISKGEMLTLLGSTAADVVLSQLDGRDAGYAVDDYYAYQYPRYYDGRYRDYNAYLNDPYYFDPYRRNVSYQYANSYIPGLYDLDYYGDWQNVDGYGYSWAPRVDAGWSPYQTGYWYNDYPYGPTWVSTEPWGYAPYHYGRWAFVGDRWYWVPESVNTTPLYSPALVAFMPFGGNDIGWVPLGPGDVYVPHYYNTSWQPYYLTNDNLYQRVVNLNVPGAVTVVSIDDFNRDFDWRRVRKADRNMLASVNPVLDPLLVTPLRNAAVRSAWGRGKIDIPPGIARKLNDTTVITSTAPAAPRFRPNLAKDLRVNTAPDRAKGQKFQVRDERRGRGAPQAAQTSQQPVAPQAQPEQAKRGAANSQRELRRIEQQQRQQQNEQRRVDRGAAQAERAARPVRQQQPQGERVAAPARPQQQQQRRVVVPQQRPQPQMRRESAPVRSQPAPRVNRPQPQPQVRREQGPPVRSQPAPRAQPQPKPAAPQRAQPQQQQKQEKAARPTATQPSQGGGKGKGPKKP